MFGLLRVPRRQQAGGREAGEELLAKVGLAERVSSSVRTSGGQQHAVAIARALAVKPKMMLF